MDKYQEQAERDFWTAFPWMTSDDGDKICAVFAQALREAAANAVESVRIEGNCRREHGGSWVDFERWMEAKAAALRGAK